jgi:hypothetical protein
MNFLSNSSGIAVIFILCLHCSHLSASTGPNHKPEPGIITLGSRDIESWRDFYIGPDDKLCASVEERLVKSDTIWAEIELSTAIKDGASQHLLQWVRSHLHDYVLAVLHLKCDPKCRIVANWKEYIPHKMDNVVPRQWKSTTLKRIMADFAFAYARSLLPDLYPDCPSLEAALRRQRDNDKQDYYPTIYRFRKDCFNQSSSEKLPRELQPAAARFRAFMHFFPPKGFSISPEIATLLDAADRRQNEPKPEKRKDAPQK